MASSEAPAIDVLQCSSEELAKYLLKHRFENDGMTTTSFLLEGTTALPNAEAIAAQIMGVAAENNGTGNDNDNIDNKVSSSRSEEDPQHTSLGEALHSKPVELSLTNPRGKFNVTFHEDGINASGTGKNPQALTISAGVVREMIVFPKPQDCQKVKSTTSKSNSSSASPMVLLCFEQDEEEEQQPVTFKDKPLNQICFAMPSTLDGIQEALSEIDSDKKQDDVEEAWIGLLRHSLQIPKTNVHRVVNPASSNGSNANGTLWTFKSHQDANTSTTSGGMPFVKCYYGVQDGCLFPMQQGLLFFKPPLFLPRSKLHSIACGRGQGNSSRYVDMVVTTSGDETMEFSNIHREELTVLNDYIYKTLIPAMQRDQAEESTTKMDEDNDNGNDTSEEDDENAVEAVAAVAEDDEEDAEMVQAEAATQVEGSRGRSKRRAAREASQQTKQHFLQKGGGDDDEEDEDESDEDDFTEADAEEDEKENACTDDEEEEDNFVVDAKKQGGKNGGKEEEEEENDDDDDDAEVEAEAEEEEDITESDAEATDDDDDDEEASPPQAKKRKSS